MVTAVTSGVKISVVTEYRDYHSNPHNSLYLFSYQITIENTNDFAVQLLRRNWHIQDSNGEKREVDGEGVVGQQPIIEPGCKFEYDSACNLNSDMGSMYGSYTFQKVLDGTTFEVDIPEFQMLVPYRMN